MRDIKYLVVHCTDTLPTAEIEPILRYWRSKGWQHPGYHYIIRANGEIVQLLDEAIPSNGVLGFNEHCINVCYIGGKTKDGKHADTRTQAQEDAIFHKLMSLSKKYPKAIVKGHGEFPNQEGRTCPNFNVREWLHSYVPKELRKDGFKDINDLHK